MATKSKKPAEPSPPTVSPKEGAELIRRQVEKGEALLSNRPIDDDKYKSWCLVTRNFLEKAFGAGSSNVYSVMNVGGVGLITSDTPESWFENRRAESLRTQIEKMKALLEVLDAEVGPQVDDTDTQVSPPPTSHRVFIVHGHDEAALHIVARFLERIHLEAVILREQPNQGRTIIEKFEDYSDVGFAIVLLTPDDRGGTATTAFADQKPRARQNVIFELGYFIGRLKRSRVCALYRPGVEMLSDYSGVLYEELDERGAWRFPVAMELRAAGFQVDMNDLVAGG
jgi:predicted nucleotide-binding protein